MGAPLEPQPRRPAVAEDDRAMIVARGRGAAEPLAMLSPALGLVGAVSFLPLVYAVWQSVHRSRVLDLGEFIFLENYEWFLFGEGGFNRIWNSLVFVAGTLLVAMPLGFALAFALDRPLRLRGLFRTLLIIPWLVSTTVAALLWGWLLNAQFGPVAHALARLGIALPNATTSEPLAMPAIVLANAWGSYPLVMIFVLAALQTIPRELVDAARIDGASGWQRFRFVLFPLIRNTTLVALVLTTLHTFNGITIVLIMTGGGPVGATDTMAFHVFAEAFKYYRMGIATAGAMIIFAVNIAFTVAYMRVLRGAEAA
jgi:ABC-type sugar transport system permease subunit